MANVPANPTAGSQRGTSAAFFDPGQSSSPELVDAPSVEVVVEEIPIEDSLGKYSLFDDTQATYVDYQVTNRFEKCRNRYMMGVSSPNGFQGNSVATAQLCSPTLLWICDWTAARLKFQPEAPNPESSDSAWVLLFDHWEPADPGLMADGVTPIYRISGTYVYGNLRPSTNTADDVFYPRPPWMQDVFPREGVETTLVQGLSEVV